MMMSADYEEQQQQQQSVPPNHTICNEEIISVDPCSILPHSGSSSIDVSSSFFYWRDLYPELSILIDNIDVIRREARNITMVCCAWMDGWMMMVMMMIQMMCSSVTNHSLHKLFPSAL
jgi:hypothetical protein